ncbi:MAG: serine hydrolase domain-containing protein [Candidatus Sulfotelmatobacter sp.]
MKPKHWLALILLLPNLSLSQAKQALVATIDGIANAALHEGPIAGMSIAVVRGNQTLLLKGYGNSNLELTTATTPDTVYHIDSITKNMTSAAVVQLAERHKLTLEDLAEKYVPEIHTIAPAATIRSLMNHTSGIPDYTDLGPKSENIEAVKFTHQQFLATIQEEKQLFPPAQLWRYSNSGFYLLGMIIEKVSGETYANYMLNHIFRPLGMDSSRYCDARSVVKNRAAGYVRSKGQLVNAEPMTWDTPFSGGGICSTVSDLITWQRALNQGLVVSQAGLAVMRAATVLRDGTTIDYGLGTRRGDLQGHPMFGHTGSGGGFNNVIEYYPDDDLTIIVLANSDTSISSLSIAGRIARALLAIPPIVVAEHSLSESDIVRYSGKFESAEGTAILFGDQGRIRVKFAENGPSLPLVYLGDGAFTTGPNTISKAYLRNGRAQGAAVYVDGLFMNATWRVPTN